MSDNKIDGRIIRVKKAVPPKRLEKKMLKKGINIE